MLRYILLAFCGLLVSSCFRKSETRYYSGIVVNKSGSPVAQATISICYRAGGGRFSDGGDEVRQLAVTKEDGNFSAKAVFGKNEYTQEFEVSAPSGKHIHFRDTLQRAASDMRIVLN